MSSTTLPGPPRDGAGRNLGSPGDGAFDKFVFPFAGSPRQFFATRQPQSGILRSPLSYAATSCLYGGTRNNSNSFTVPTWPVSPAAIADVRCCHFLGEPIPFVGIG